jgi:hypothetical protein
MAAVAESVTARALGLKPQLRVIEGGNVKSDDGGSSKATEVAA